MTSYRVAKLAAASFGHSGAAPAPQEIAIQEGIGEHWKYLRFRAEEALARIDNDPELANIRQGIENTNEVIAELHHDPLESDEDVRIRLLANFIDRIGAKGRELIDVEEAVEALIEASWEVNNAFETYLLDDEDEQSQSSGDIEKNKVQREEEVASDEMRVKLVHRAAAKPPTGQHLMQELNADINRAPAVKGKVHPKKLVITLKQLDGKEDLVFAFRKLNGGMTMDWSDSKHIRALNRWRSQIFGRELGRTRSFRHEWHPDEIQWLIDYHRQFEVENRDKDGMVPWKEMDWVQLTVSFNNQFEGKVLSGSRIPRPARTKPALNTSIYRMPEICKITGKNWKGDGVLEGSGSN